MTVSVVRNMTDALPAPRNVLVKFRLGQVFGEPGREAQQRTIVRASLAVLDEITESGAAVELPYRWRQEVYGEGPAAR